MHIYFYLFIYFFETVLVAHLGKSSTAVLRKEGLGLLHIAHEVNIASQEAVVTVLQDKDDPQDSKDLELNK